MTNPTTSPTADQQPFDVGGFLPPTTVTMLACPIAGCDHYEDVSEEDPDCTLSEMVAHLRGYFRGQHRLDTDEAMTQLAKVREVRRD